jgi:hypothetical protein
MDGYFNWFIYYIKTSLFYFSLYFEGSPPSRRSLGSYVVGEIMLYFYVPMFPGKIFLMGQIRKV